MFHVYHWLRSHTINIENIVYAYYNTMTYFRGGGLEVLDPPKLKKKKYTMSNMDYVVFINNIIP